MPVMPWTWSLTLKQFVCLVRHQYRLPLSPSEVLPVPYNSLPIEVPEGISVNPIDPFEPGIEAEVLISLDGIFDNDTYPILFQAVSEGDTLLRTITVSTISNDFSELATIAPAQGASGLSTRPTFMWDASPNALSYDVQLSASPAFDDPSTLIREGLVDNFVQFDSLLQENNPLLLESTSFQ